MSGGLPQAEREANGLGAIALVGLADLPQWTDDPRETLEGPVGERLRELMLIDRRDWNRWFDRVTLVEQSCDPRAGLFARELLPSLCLRPRMVILGRKAAEAFGVWEDDCFLRWRWARWSALHQGLLLPTDERQLFAVVQLPGEGDHDDALIFWRALARAIKSKRART
tara:strand:- start:27457 stop:27960 length:504 start_codon:yes stop_codon:yes gene_type:complete